MWFICASFFILLFSFFCPYKKKWRNLEFGRNPFFVYMIAKTEFFPNKSQARFFVLIWFFYCFVLFCFVLFFFHSKKGIAFPLAIALRFIQNIFSIVFFRFFSQFISLFTLHPDHRIPSPSSFCCEKGKGPLGVTRCGTSRYCRIQHNLFL